ncbi:ArsR/SmtB family transcription factor [Pseudoprimorskyibacter insulae]|uniref:Putative HTH-type transcriptional regulator YgaV n=1 Tax=Pseudoprimorskyibacter insulae TaxID=1695997 RepID=A0A2R8AY10_9RHOB|nr:helix-turn-helix transcriptional regulator [Pseudoprimorskyibacter insulae]SPF80890.1 putative HTH-type transcriptional regulator YgaV [Pseudoprimorskyibacter insulae]
MEQSRVLAALSAMAHDKRLEIVRLLASHAPVGLHAGDIAAQTGLGASALSFHLTALTDAALVKPSREGRHIRYRLCLGHVGAVFAYLLNDCCGAAPEIRDRCLHHGCADQSGIAKT